MIPRWTGPSALLLLSLIQAESVSAQGPSTEPPQPNADEPSLDVSRLPINIQRIERQLRQTSVREQRDGLNLRYIVDVYGQAPRLELLTKEDNLLRGPVPYGAPTHRELVDAVTPQEYRAPVADFGALFRWLANKTKDKSDKK